jgi:hypothetical protein
MEILTRLPCSEREFQSDKAVAMEFLAGQPLQASTETLSTSRSSIQLVALCGQVLSHQQQGNVEHTHGFTSLEFWDRQQQLNARLELAFKGMPLGSQSALVLHDLMACFSLSAAQVSALMLFSTSQTSPWGMEGDSNTVAKCEKRARSAVQQITVLSKALIELSYFEVIPAAVIPSPSASND